MPSWIFPEKRFQEAGVSTEDIDAMRREFNEYDLSIQRAQCEYWQTQSINGLRDYAERRRGWASESSESAPESSVSASDASHASLDDQKTGDSTGDPDASLD
jgi:hypothetical protein